MDKLEDQIVSLEKTLKGTEDTDEKEKTARMALVKQAAQEMSEEEKKEARKAFDESEDKSKQSKKSTEDKIDPKESKKSTDEIKEKESNNDETKQSKKSQDYDELKKANDELEKKVASLTASTNYLTAKPYVEKMLVAREAAGMDSESIQAFRKSLYGKTVDEIKQRYDEDRVLYKQSLAAGIQSNADIPFNGEEFNSLVGSDNNEEMTLETLSE